MFSRFSKWLIILVWMPMLCVAVTVKQSAPEVYVVKKGDTLWDISSLYLDKPWQWPELWRNNTHIVNPHLIYPGDELRLSYDLQGEAQIEVVREPEVVKPNIKLSPSGIKTYRQQQSIPVLPISIIQPHIEHDLIMSMEDYSALPHLLGDHDGSVRFASGDLVLGQTDLKHDTYSVLRQQNEIINLDGEVIGLQIRHVANANPVASNREQQTLISVTQANFEAKRGDRLQPRMDSKQDDLSLVAAESQKGYIVDSLQQHSLLGKYDVVVVDLGEQSVSPGTVMGIYMQGPQIVDNETPRYVEANNMSVSNLFFDDEISQPALKIGELVVFQVFDSASYALITDSSKIIRRGAIVAHP